MDTNKIWDRVKKIVKEAGLLLLLIFIFSNIIGWLRAPKLESNTLMLTKATLIDGSAWRYEEGKPLVLHFWGMWCPVCRTEAANVDAVSKAYNVVTVAVNSGDDTTVAHYLNEHNLNFKVINDPHGKLAKRFKVTVFPTTFMFDADGRLKFTETGYTSTAGLLARLKIAQ